MAEDNGYWKCGENFKPDSTANWRNIAILHIALSFLHLQQNQIPAAAFSVAGIVVCVWSFRSEIHE
jgi:hypothetical protein